MMARRWTRAQQVALATGHLQRIVAVPEDELGVVRGGPGSEDYWRCLLCKCGQAGLSWYEAGRQLRIHLRGNHRAIVEID